VGKIYSCYNTLHLESQRVGTLLSVIIGQRTITGYRMCIDFRKLNKVTKKDHCTLPFMDQMLERLSKHSHFCYSGFLRFLSIKMIKRILLLHVLLVLLLIEGCLLVYEMRLLLFKHA
jgi:hypothetical protein